ncbi:non-structural maintenance of chromosomes element 1 homolog [Paramacrobiotus metropolitanus]|uniref:non-structural maintenance of chromosomes element 1 homolog n=1 Tax=Paramacrobiotus metropolitanus TaxID=2943436 RepID=UPI0024464EB8|nr:non-structural maintenance of chromosomes element 1 homolog [Paramacrobiotus metropolitanus]
MSQRLRTSPRRTRQQTQQSSQNSQASRDASPRASTSGGTAADVAEAGPVIQEAVDFARFGSFHRSLLNVYMNSSMLNSATVHQTFRQTCEAFGVKCPETPQEYLKSLATTISVINTRLKKYNLVIKRVSSGNSVESYYCLANSSKGGVYKLQEIFKAAELELLYNVVPKILESERGFITKHQAMSRDAASQFKISQHAASDIVNQFINLGFLTESDDDQGKVSLGPRTLAELEPFLRDTNRDAVQMCALCRGLITAQAYQCTNVDCRKRCHSACLVRMISPRNQNTNVRCPNCTSVYPADAVQRYRRLGKQKCQQLTDVKETEEQKRVSVQEKEEQFLHPKKNYSPTRDGRVTRNSANRSHEQIDE